MPIKARHREIAWSLTEAVVLGVASVATGAHTPYRLNRALYRVLRNGILQEFNRRYIPQALRRAEQRGFIRVWVSRGGSIATRVTEEGQKLLARRQLEGAAAQRPKRWDGLWRVLIFDVPETRRRDRNVLRKTLHNLGFVPLQESVWAYPYDCRALIATMRTAYNLSHITVRCIVAQEIEDDHALRLQFRI